MKKPKMKPNNFYNDNSEMNIFCFICENHNWKIRTENEVVRNAERMYP